MRPPGMGHLEDPTLHERPHRRARLRSRHDRAAAVDLDGLHRRRPGRDDRRPRVGGRARRLRVVGAARARAARGWRRTGCCARARSGATATPTRCAARSATPTTPTASPSIPPAAKELRLFGLAGWTIDRFVAPPHAAARAAVRGDAAAREAAVVEPAARRSAPTSSCSGRCADAAADGRISTSASSSSSRRRAVGTSLIAFGGLNWALDGAAAPVAAVLRLEPAMAPAGALPSGRRAPPAGMPAREIRFRDVDVRLSRRRAPVLERLRPDDSRRLVARDRRPERRRQDDARQAAVPAVRPAVGRDRGRRRRPARARSRVVAVARHRGVPGLHPLRAAAARQRRAGGRARRRRARGARVGRRRRVSPRSTRCSRAATTGGTDLSGGQWQRVALARALCAVRLGAGVVLLDEPTAQLDVRGEAEIFERILAATRALHDDPHLAPLLDRAPRRSHLRARARPGRRARHARRADGARRPLPDDVRPAGAALQRGRGRGGQDAMTSSPERDATAATRRPAAGAVVDVAAVQARLPARAAADARRVRAVAARRAARRAARALAQAARRRASLAQRPRLLVRRRDRARRVGDRDLVPAHRQHARAAPLPRQGDDRARVARRAAAGVDRDHRAPRAARLPRSAVGAAQPGLRARPHVHVAVLDVRLDPAARRHGRAARCRFIRRWCCSRCSRCRRC